MSTVMTVLAVAALSACGDDGTGSAGSTIETSTVATTVSDTTTTTTPTTTPAEWAGPPVLVTATDRDLVAVDLVAGEHVVIADGSELADSFGIAQGRFEDADLSPDGSTVAFTFGAHDGERPAYGLYEVPVDGSAAPTKVALESVDEYSTRPRYSPDGRLLAVYHLDRLLVLDNQRRATHAGLPMPYAPHQLTWDAAGERLVWLEHFERTSCCDRGSAAVDPSTGRLNSEPTREPTDGSPYVDAEGALATLPTNYTAFSVDRSGRFVVASDGTRGVLWWWELDGDEPTRRHLGLGWDRVLQEVPPVAW